MAVGHPFRRARSVTLPTPPSPTRRLSAAERGVEAAMRGPALLRGAAGRLAARKGLHAHALACAPDDPYVLARAGFFHDVPEDGAPVAAELAALAGLGMTDALLEQRERWDQLRTPDRLWIAGLAAGWDALAANLLLPPSSPLESAACLLAEELVDEAEAAAGPAHPSPERSLLLAAIAADREDWRAVRTLINAAFEAQGLDLPLAAGETPPTLGAFAACPAAPGSVSGPRVSIVLAVKDSVGTIGLALRSLLAQTWADLEVLVVDDGSSDGTVEAIDAVAAKDSRVRRLANDRTPGAYGARNVGIAAATGDYVGFHDGDDWAHPRRIEQQVRAIEGRGVLAAVSKHFRLSTTGAPVAPRVFPMVRACPITVLVRADAAREAGPMEEVPLGADSEYLARMDLLFGRRSVARLPAIHLVAGWAPSSLSGAAETGLVSSEGRDLRAAYERDWRRRHAERLKAMVG